MFLYTSDRFKKPSPFKADIAVSIEDVIETKVKAIAELESQVFDGGAMGNTEKAVKSPLARMMALLLGESLTNFVIVQDTANCGFAAWSNGWQTNKTDFKPKPIRLDLEFPS